MRVSFHRSVPIVLILLGVLSCRHDPPRTDSTDDSKRRASHEHSVPAEPTGEQVRNNSSSPEPEETDHDLREELDSDGETVWIRRELSISSGGKAPAVGELIADTDLEVLDSRTAVERRCLERCKAPKLTQVYRLEIPADQLDLAQKHGFQRDDVNRADSAGGSAAPSCSGEPSECTTTRSNDKPSRREASADGNRWEMDSVNEGGATALVEHADDIVRAEIVRCGRRGQPDGRRPIDLTDDELVTVRKNLEDGTPGGDVPLIGGAWSAVLAIETDGGRQFMAEPVGPGLLINQHRPCAGKRANDDGEILFDELSVVVPAENEEVFSIFETHLGEPTNKQYRTTPDSEKLLDDLENDD